MSLTIPLPPDIQTKLSQRAAAAGTDVVAYVQQLIRQHIDNPLAQDIDEILAPLRSAFAASGVSDDELLADIDAARDEYRARVKKRTS